MNICIVSNFPIDPLNGGIERVSHNLVREFIRGGHAVVCVYYKLSGTPPKDCGEQLQFPDKEDIAGECNSEFLRGVIERYGVDVVINQAQYVPAFHDLCVKARESTGAKLVIVFHNAPDGDFKVLDDNDDYIKFRHTGGRLSLLSEMTRRRFWRLTWRRSFRKKIGRMYKKFYDESDALVLLSERFEKKFTSIARLKRTDKLHAISNPVIPVDPPLGERKNHILFVARMTYVQKRADRMLEIWAKVWRDHPDWTLYMLGGGDDAVAAQIKEYAGKLGLENVVFTGTVPPEPYYREAKILCLTSSYEGFGMVLVEAQQNGCVPIAYDSYEALGDIIDNGNNGFKVRPFCKGMFVRKLRLLMDDEALRGRMAERGLETVKRFDVGRIAGEWIKLFEELKDK